MKGIKLPEKITVKVVKCEHNKFIAELPEYNVHTEADNVKELVRMVNDLIYSYFDIPEKVQKSLKYKPLDDVNFLKAKPFIMFSTPDFYREYFN